MLLKIMCTLVLINMFEGMLVQTAALTKRPGRAVEDWVGFVERANGLEETNERHKQIIYEVELTARNSSTGPHRPFRWASPSPKPTVAASSIYNVPVMFSHKERNESSDDGDNVKINITLTVTAVGQRLLLAGCQSLQLVSANAIDYVRDVIAEHLESTELSSQVEHAQRLEDGILFQMSSTEATVKVLALSSLLLQGACFRIEPSNEDFVTVAQHIRFGL